MEWQNADDDAELICRLQLRTDHVYNAWFGGRGVALGSAGVPPFLQSVPVTQLI
jgi:hypothetical protein